MSNPPPKSEAPEAESTQDYVLRLIGPGVVTGASDDDPSGIATYSQIGAQFGFGMLWTVLLSLPLMTAVQEICGRLGRVTGKGLAANLKEHFPRWFLVSIVGLVVVANVINIAADISALGAAVALMLPGPGIYYSVVLTLISIALQVFVPYHRYISVLKWLTFSLLSYVVAVFVVDVPWREVAWATVTPHLSLSSDFVTGFVAVLGTTISPYLFFWQASEEVEDEEAAPGEHPLLEAPAEAPEALKRIHLDTIFGMVSATVVFYCIVLVAAVTLHAHGVTNIETAADAAQALRPLAGEFAFFLFALGIVGTGLLAIPVLAGSAAYAVGESIGIRVGLEQRPGEAKAFYGIIVLTVAAGLLLNAIQMSPMKALYWAAVVNGVAAGPILAAVMLVSQNREWMHEFAVRGWLRVCGWLACAVMTGAAIWLLVASW